MSQRKNPLLDRLKKEDAMIKEQIRKQQTGEQVTPRGDEDSLSREMGKHKTGTQTTQTRAPGAPEQKTRTLGKSVDTEGDSLDKHMEDAKKKASSTLKVPVVPHLPLHGKAQRPTDPDTDTSRGPVAPRGKRS